MKVKVLNYLDADYGNIMDTFVFKEEADIEEIKNTVQDIFEKECGERPYCDIMTELFGHLMLNVIENEDVDW